MSAPRWVLATSAALLLLALTPAFAKKPDTATLTGEAIVVEAQPIVAFDPVHAGERRFGKLEFLGGLVLTSPSRNFGGWSALALDGDGKRLLSISDTGVWLTGELTYTDGHPSGIADARLGPLLGFDGKPFARRKERDSEGLALVSGTLDQGEALVSFEGQHRILRYPVSRIGVGAPLASLSLPADTARMGANKSLESVCVLKAGPEVGAVVTLAERYPPENAANDHVGWLMNRAGSWRRLAITDIDDFYLTDCHGLPDGSMLVLERRFRWKDVLDGVRMRLRRFTPAEIASATPMAGEILINASKTHEIDNMEGLASHPGPNGTTILTMISDDNFNHLMQRTVLLQFALPAPEAVAGRSQPAPSGR